MNTRICRMLKMLSIVHVRQSIFVLFILAEFYSIHVYRGGCRISFKGAPFIVMRAKIKNHAHFMLNHAHLRHIAGENRVTSESAYARKLSKGKLQQESLST